jgi:hypothetical protein
MTFMSPFMCHSKVSSQVIPGFSTPYHSALQKRHRNKAIKSDAKLQSVVDPAYSVSQEQVLHVVVKTICSMDN